MKRILNMILGLFGEKYKMYENIKQGKWIVIIATQCGDFYLEKIDTNGDILLTTSRKDALRVNDDSKVFDILDKEEYKYTTVCGGR